MTALEWIVTEAKKIKKQYPKRFKTWREYVAQASAIYSSKHRGKSPVGKKKVGAVKIIQKGEKKDAKVTKVLQQVRGKSGVFKGYKKIGKIGNITEKDFLRIDNDTYGNPRYVIHWTALGNSYEGALKIARKIGGKKYHNKKYGGGIVFQSYNINATANRLNDEYKKSISGTHKDTKSHNVNIRVVSGVDFTENEIKFLESESKKSKGYKYRAKVLFGQDIVLKETKNGTPIQKFIVDDFDKALKLAKALNDGYKFSKIRAKKI